jgi:PAS domain S-box-containing protein
MRKAVTSVAAVPIVAAVLVAQPTLWVVIAASTAGAGWMLGAQIGNRSARKTTRLQKRSAVSSANHAPRAAAAGKAAGPEAPLAGVKAISDLPDFALLAVSAFPVGVDAGRLLANGVAPFPAAGGYAFWKLERRLMSPDPEELAQRQRALADFGEFALRCDDLQTILEEGCRLVAGALGADLAKILEIEPGKNTALVRAGVGWRPGIVGKQRLSLHDRSSEAFAIRGCEPVVTHDIAKENRFGIPEFMREHGIVALVNVPIFLPGLKPFGILEVDAREPRDFPDHDVQFLRTYSATLGPVIDRLYQVADLERSNERFRLVVENARDFAILMSDSSDIITDWFAGAEDIFGWSEAEMLGKPVSAIFTEQDKEVGAHKWETDTAEAYGKAPDVRWHETKSGKRVYLDGQTIAMHHPNGKLRGFLKIAQNLTERKQTEERQTVLLAELQHRVRNVLAMVAAIVKRGDVGGTTREFRDRLSGRISAMARTQALLTRGAGVGVDLEGMVRDELVIQAAGEHGFVIAGPSITLAPKAAEVLTLAVHELATNACKYGAFSQPNGRIDVHWAVEEREDQNWLEFSWIESGVELGSEPPRRKGFGTELVTRRVPYELRGKGDLKLAAGGIQCRLAFPLIQGESILQEGLSPASRAEGGS